VINSIDVELRAFIARKDLMSHTLDQIKYLEKFIINHELSALNPIYYIYYPAKASVEACKAQLKGCYAGLEEMERNI